MLTTIKGNLRPIRDKVLVTNMHFGEQRTRTGIILRSDDGKTHGIHPRWGQVYAKGPENKEEYEVGDWILVEHGRWTHGVVLDRGDEEITVRMIDTDNILLYSKEQPDDIILGDE